MPSTHSKKRSYQTE